MNSHPLQVIRMLPWYGWLALAFLASSVAAAAWSVGPLVEAMTAPPLPELEAGGLVRDVESTYLASLNEYKSFVDDASPFFEPAAPEPVVVQAPPPVRETPPPQVYEGPGLLGIFGDRVFFDDVVSGTRKDVRVGETGGLVEVVRVDSPWNVVVRWKGQEFTINLFDPSTMSLQGGFGMFGGTNGMGRTQSTPPTRQPALFGGDEGDLGLPQGDLFVPVEEDEESSGRAGGPQRPGRR